MNDHSYVVKYEGRVIAEFYDFTDLLIWLRGADDYLDYEFEYTIQRRSQAIECAD